MTRADTYGKQLKAVMKLALRLTYAALLPVR